MKRNHRGFSLVEMLVVIAIIAVLAAILLPSISGVRSRSRKTQCMNNVRQIATGAAAMFSEMGDKLPTLSDASKSGEAAEQILPYVKNIIEVFDCPANDGILQDSTTEFPSHAGQYTEYAINSNLCSTSGNNRRQNAITDYSIAAYAYDVPYLSTEPRRAHEGGINCAYLDGHAAWLEDADMLSPTNFEQRGFAF